MTNILQTNFVGIIYKFVKNYLFMLTFLFIKHLLNLFLLDIDIYHLALLYYLYIINDWQF